METTVVPLRGAENPSSAVTSQQTAVVVFGVVFFFFSEAFCYLSVIFRGSFTGN